MLIGVQMLIQLKVDWMALHSTNALWTKTYSKSNPGVFEGKKVDFSAMIKSISWSQPDWACISLAEDTTKCRKTHKQTTTEVSCSKGLAKHQRRPSLWWCPLVPDLRQSLPAKDSHFFFYDYIYLSNYIWSPENGGTVYKNGYNS